MAEPKKSNVEQLRKEATNMISKERTEEIFLKFEDYDERLATQKGKHMAKCKVIRDERDEFYGKIMAEGLSKKALVAAYNAKKDIERAKARAAKLNEDTAPIFDHVVKQMELF